MLVKPYPYLALVDNREKWCLEYDNKRKIDNIRILVKPKSKIKVTLDELFQKNTNKFVVMIVSYIHANRKSCQFDEKPTSFSRRWVSLYLE
jgi:hypothetical protein